MEGSIMFFCPREVNAKKGGIERVTDSLARFLIDRGHRVVFLSVEHTGRDMYDCVAPQYFTKKKGNDEWISHIIRQHNVRLIINQMSLFCFCKRSSLPEEVRVITVMHDSYFAMYPRLRLNFLRKWKWKLIIGNTLRKNYAQSDSIVVFFPEFIDEYQYFYAGAGRDKFKVIPNFNSYTCTHAADKEKKLLWVGRHSEWHKRTCDMLRIWSQLEPRFPEWSLDILGDGPDNEDVRKLHASLGLKRCNLCGVMDPKPYYEKAAVICMTSSFESFGMVLTEGMQHGCVPVAYNAYTAVRHLIQDGRNGLLVAPFDIDEYVGKLAFLMENAVVRERISLAAIESVKRFDAERIMSLWLELIETPIIRK